MCPWRDGGQFLQQSDPAHRSTLSRVWDPDDLAVEKTRRYLIEVKDIETGAPVLAAAVAWDWTR